MSYYQPSITTMFTSKPCSQGPYPHFNRSRDCGSTTLLCSLFFVPMFFLFMKKHFLMPKLKLLWCNLRLFPLVACYTQEVANPHLATAACQVVAEISNVPPHLPFHQAKHPMVPIGLVLQTLSQLLCHSLDILQYLKVFLVMRGPKLGTALRARSHRYPVEWGQLSG